MSCPDTAWFHEARFGLFLHWGLYSLDGIHEQAQWRCRISRKEYARLADRFEAEHFDAEDWVAFAKSIGAGYIVFTSKHHDGFCLWDSDQTGFKSTNTPAKRDFVRELAQACHREAMPLGIYYSVVDWKHPSYPNEDRHHELPPQPNDKPDWDKYIDYLNAQCEELCTRYGKIHLWWWDMNVPEVVDPSINAAIRKWQPGILINNRGMDEGDFKTPEREVLDDGTEARIYHQLTEACESVSPQAWCHRPGDALHHASYLIRNLTRHMAKGGNYLLNLGPDAQGALPEPDKSRVAEVGRWFLQMRKALTAEPVTEFFEQSDLLYTRDGNTLYVIICNDPKAEAIELPPLTQKPVEACILNDGGPLTTSAEWLPMHFYKAPSTPLRLHGLPSALPGGYPLILKLNFARLSLNAPRTEQPPTIL